MAESKIRIGGFTGLNTRDDPSMLADSELSAVKNFDIGQNGELIKRTGFKEMHNGATLGASSVHVLGLFNTATYQQFIGVAQNNVYYSTDGVVWTVMPGGPWAGVEYGVQYTDKFYMVRSASTIVQWTGAVASAIAGSPSGTFCKVYKDRLFVINSSAAGVDASRIRFSEPFDFSATGWVPTNYIGVGEGDGDWLIACENIQDTLVLFKAGSMWNLYVQGADTLSWILRPFKNDLGCISKYTLHSHEGLLFFVGQWGVYSTNGSDVVRVSSPVDPYFTLITLAQSTLNSTSAFIWKDKYVVTLPSFADTPLWSAWNLMTWSQLSTTLWAGGSTEAQILVYDIKRRSWTSWESQLRPHRFIVVGHTTTLKGVWCGARTADGKVYKYGDNIYKDGVSAKYTTSFSTKEFDFGKPVENKRGKWIGLALSGAGNYLIWHTINDHFIQISRTYLVAGQSQVKILGPGYFRNWRFELSAITDAPITIYGLTLYMHSAEHRPIRLSQ